MLLLKEIAKKDNWIAHTEVTENSYLVLSTGVGNFTYAVYSFNIQAQKYSHGFYFYSAQEALEHYQQELNLFRNPII